MNNQFLTHSLGRRLYRAESVRAIDSAAISSGQVTGLQLMQLAAEAAFEKIVKRWSLPKSMLVLCGGGNNAGDGYLLAVLAKAAGVDVTLHAVVDIEKLNGDAKLAAEAWLNAGGKAEDLHPPYEYDRYDCVVDALLGVGISRAVSGRYQQIIEAVNQRHGRGVIALDLPSGLNPNTGAVSSVAVHAEITVTFVAMKPGLITGVAQDYVGDVHLADLNVDSTIFAKHSADMRCLSQWDLKVFQQPRLRTSHKGRNGHLLMVGGDSGMSGAIRLSAEAALRSGAGLVSVATHPAHAHMVNIGCPEIMSQAMLDEESFDDIEQKADVLAIGPGLGHGAWSEWLFEAVIDTNLPMIIDADGLNWLAKGGDKLAHTLRLREKPLVITPHPGEAARLLSTEIDVIQADRIAAAKALHERFGAIVILKGAGTIIADDNELSICPYGNPGLAVGGSGDVLTGVVAALLGQMQVLNISAEEATKLAVLTHSIAADFAAADGERGMLPTDVIAQLRAIVSGKQS